jgi:putative endonuclease
MGGWVYILLCSDGTFYVGVTSRLIERLREHMRGSKDLSYTASRLPVRLVWCQFFPTILEAIAGREVIEALAARQRTSPDRR